MSTVLDETIQVVTSSQPANFPFSVQVQNTENWSTTEASVTLAAAMDAAKLLTNSHPNLPVRIEHATGGPKTISVLPVYKHRALGEMPYSIALWDGKNTPPAVGEQVYLKLNNLGLGTVTGYAVEDGYLGLMVKIEDAARPQWHKDHNPTNRASIAFGREIRNA